MQMFWLFFFGGGVDTIKPMPRLNTVPLSHRPAFQQAPNVYEPRSPHLSSVGDNALYLGACFQEDLS